MNVRQTRVAGQWAATWLVLAMSLSAGGPVAATPPPERLALLRHGINVVHWFRFPPRLEVPALAAYLDDAALIALRRAGFTFIRLPVQPEVIMSGDGLADPARMAALRYVVHRIEAQKLAVILVAYLQGWRLEVAADQGRLAAFWTALTPLVRSADAALTFVEPVNEPVFASDPAAWEALQRRLVGTLRAQLPTTTFVLSGNDWSSVEALTRLAPVSDQNVIYSFHFYEPPLLTTLGAFAPALDHAALATLPYPAGDRGRCDGAVSSTDPETRKVAAWYCASDGAAGVVADRIAAAAAWARRNRTTVAMTEFGATARLAAESRLAWLAATRRAAEAEGFGWALWGYDDVMGFDRSAGDGSALDPAVMRALGLAQTGKIE